ncbi:MAG: helix-turn-helix domain-containing protein [Chloroflexi bacterium]|nr:helix-turn-helix domain-containing protein [Chloroflexota bacterium]
MVTNIGERIKTLRIENQMTLADLSQKTNLSISYLSQVERDKTTPSLATIIEIGNALGVNPRYFFEVDPVHAFVIRANINDIEKKSRQTAEIFPISPTNEPSRLRVWQYNLEPGKEIKGIPEVDSEKFCYVLTGVLTLEIGEEVITLNEGDSIAFDAAHSHIFRNNDENLCSFIYACATMKIQR